MTYKVLKDFIDAETKQYYVVGSEYPSDADPKRVQSLLAKTSKFRHESLNGSPVIEEVVDEDPDETPEDNADLEEAQPEEQ